MSVFGGRDLQVNNGEQEENELERTRPIYSGLLLISPPMKQKPPEVANPIADEDPTAKDPVTLHAILTEYVAPHVEDPRDIVSVASSILEENHSNVEVSHTFQSKSISAKEAVEYLNSALTRFRQPKRYGQRAALTMNWENDDVGAKADSAKMADLLRNIFGFTVDSFKIPERNSEAKIKAAILSFIGEHDEEDELAEPSLLIFHFAGHGLKMKDHTLSICGKSKHQIRRTVPSHSYDNARLPRRSRYSRRRARRTDSGSRWCQW